MGFSNGSGLEGLGFVVTRCRINVCIELDQVHRIKGLVFINPTLLVSPIASSTKNTTYAH